MRGVDGVESGPHPPAAIDHWVRAGQLPVTTEVSQDRVLWAKVLLHPAFRRATAPPAEDPLAGLVAAPLDRLTRWLGDLSAGQRLAFAAALVAAGVLSFVLFGRF